MGNLYFNDISYTLKHFSISKQKFDKYLAGESGDKKQLFALVLRNYDKKFIDLVLSNEQLIGLDGIKYLDENNTNSFFGFRKYNIQKWKSKAKQKLKKCLFATPICYVNQVKSSQISLSSLNTLFAKVKEYKASDKVCSLCIHNNTCADFIN